MPMIDVYATAGTFKDKHTLAQALARAVMRWEKVPDIPLFADNFGERVGGGSPRGADGYGGVTAFVESGATGSRGTGASSALLSPPSYDWIRFAQAGSLSAQPTSKWYASEHQSRGLRPFDSRSAFVFCNCAVNSCFCSWL